MKYIIPHVHYTSRILHVHYTSRLSVSADKLSKTTLWTSTSAGTGGAYRV